VGLPKTTGRLTKEHRQRGERPTYWPAVVVEADKKTVTPLAWQGSGDLRTLADANCLAYFPGVERTFQPGETVEVLKFV
jgi:molybdopterin biosynthesis enzyme